LIVTAISFRLVDPHDDRLIGFGVICAPVRYASAWRLGAPRPDRRHGALAAWQGVESEVRAQLPAAPLPTTSAIAGLLAASPAIAVQYMTAVPLELAHPAQAAELLDARLQQLVLEHTR
jgi:hypothetical protein